MASQVQGLLPDRARAALLVLDMISDFQFPDGARVGRAATRIAPRIAALKAKCVRAGLACIYVNDNPGRWQSNSARLIEESAKPGAAGARIARQLRPGPLDYLILKPRHSAFYATPLDVLLEHLGTERLILTGVSCHQCVLFTANDAHLRNLEVTVPSDCVGSPDARDTRFALQYFARVLGARVTPSVQLKPKALSRGKGR
jgi:nicotinamidase-related amidase